MKSATHETTARKPLIEALRGERGAPPPVWLMRQAGRYLPEYRELRAKAGGFLRFCYTPELAVEATLQPIRRFAMDGAILFSDILVIPHALGQDLAFLEGEGPHLSPPLVDHALNALEPAHARLEPIYRTVRLVREQLEPETTLLGFAGSPWT
ncbi:MAG TPA: uroporphyrinogen decarboxylase family protein, partial [Alphaproteobacteria bacterium]